MKSYELTYLISPDLSEQEVNSLVTEINSFIKEKGGLLENNLSPLKKQLSYPIAKKTMAYLVSANFQLKPEELMEIKKQLRLKPEILRFLIVNILIKKTKSRLRPASKISLKKETPNKKVDFKEIEKKLEEIL